MTSLAEKLNTARLQQDLLAVSDYPSPSLALHEALSVQQELAVDRGTVAGWKIGKMPSGEAAFAPIYQQDVILDGQRFSQNQGPDLAVEVELAFVLEKDIPPFCKQAEVAWDAVGQVVLGIELVQFRLADVAQADLTLKVADNFGNAGYIIGPQIQAFQKEQLGATELHLQIDGQTIHNGMAKNGLGDPLALFYLAAAGMGDHLGGFRAGQFITTGSFSGCKYYPVGSHVSARMPQYDATMSCYL
ncbi:fumarylacetoacetate hydrolase family protein [Polycladidibacter hongkongensis]|uniref:fumarylacetoacetate hydrolase family protein n=1 Tax=Polycladidibacter hongkongensis TaxID=1647556 RepID=UPI0008304ABF|nr:fumarylacetoacetate hydrolase family protein [Pseudovibrio hongkongensis]